MRKLVSHLITTLDGVVHFEAAMDTIGRLRDTPAVLDDFFGAVADEDAMLLGRVTYQEWAGYWPTVTDGPFAAHINRVPKYVASTTLAATPWGQGNDATVLKGDLGAAVAELKRQPGGTIGVHGSPALVESLFQAGVLDELRLEVYPVVAGRGGRLFPSEQASRELALVRSKVTDNGVAILTYGVE